MDNADDQSYRGQVDKRTYPEPKTSSTKKNAPAIHTRRCMRPRRKADHAPAVPAIAAGARHSMALKSDGTVGCWGEMFRAQV